MIPVPPLFVFWYDFSKWLFNKTEKFPKKVRFSFSNRIDNLVLDVIEEIIEARYSEKKRDILRRIDLDMEKKGCAASCTCISGDAFSGIQDFSGYYPDQPSGLATFSAKG